jgi:stage II sporulation protein AA (anti-sigma F factor antagonist)
MATDDHLQIDVRHEHDRRVLCLRGELDLASAPLLQREIESDESGATTTVVLDLEQLKFIDSTGLRVILLAQEHSREHSREFAVTRGSQQVQRLLAITGVSEHLRIITSSDELLV